MTSMHARDIPVWMASWVIWRLLPRRASMKMAEFAFTEAGSGLDMLAAVEETPRRDLRLRYYQHALDELQHSVLFRDAAKALAPNRSRVDAVLDDSGYISQQGINTKDTLFTRLDETEFLAFVWVHELRGAQQFALYSDLLKHDADMTAMFARIARDERFHISYSRAELDRLAEAGASKAVRKAILSVRWSRLKQAWLRFARNLGDLVANLWLALFYLLAVGPFSLIARISERPAVGILPPESDRPARERALELG